MASPLQNTEVCGMCGGEILEDDRASLLKNGADTIKRISEDLKDGMKEKIESMKYPIPIHKSCRLIYTRPSVIKTKKRQRDENEQTSHDEHVYRSQVKKYNPYTDCCLCNSIIPYFKNCSKENPENYNTKVPTDKRDHCVETKELAQTIIRKAKERNDAWGEEVEYRLNPFLENSDLVAAEAKLHGECQVMHFELCYTV